MLPWKRHKFELLAAEEAPPAAPSASASASASPPSRGPAAKGPGVGGGVGGGVLPCACPAESALSRVGHLFRSKRQKFRVSREAPTYTVLYLGNATTLQAKGEGCTDAAVGRIWARSEGGRLGTKMKLTIGPQGIRLAPAAPAGAEPARPGHLYLLHRVTYCVADARLPRLFAWIYRHEGRHKAVLLRCHAVLVSKAEKARAMALLLFQTSAAALADFRRLKKRADARRQQLQQAGPAALPLVPLRRLLLRAGPGGAYKPPAERGRSAPKLGSITEDALGEELEERAARLARARHPPRDGGGGEEAAGEEDDCDDDDDGELLAPLAEGEAGPPPSLGRLIRDLGRLAIGNDPALLRADLRVTRLLSGESTGSESSIESNGPDGGSPPQPSAGRDSPEPDSA